MKKYMIALFVAAAVFNTNPGFAQTKSKQKTPEGCPVVARHHAKHRAVKKVAPKMVEETITVDTRSPISVVEINKGKVYVNDSFVATVRNPRYEDHKLIINYIAPPPPPAPVVENIDRSSERTFTGNKHESPMLGIFMYSGCDNEARVDAVIPCSPADKAGLLPET